MKKYLTIFRISWQRELEYRFNFALGRLRSIVVLLLLYSIWHTLASTTGTFAGYTQRELITYVLGANILRSIVFGAQARSVAAEINDGTFSTYLVKPVNHFLFVFFRELAQRSISTVSAVIEVALFSFLVDARIFLQVDWRWNPFRRDDLPRARAVLPPELYDQPDRLLVQGGDGPEVPVRLVSGIFLRGVFPDGHPRR